mgnify:CR=1 FL=1
MEFYFQIKGKRAKKDPDRNNGLYGGISNWVHPPLFSGKVAAENKDEASEIINKLYDKKFPRRISKKDLKSNEFLLHIEEIKSGSYTESLFDEKECEHCKRPYRMIDEYNDSNCDYQGWGFCSYHCKNQAYQIQPQRFSLKAHALILYQYVKLLAVMDLAPMHRSVLSVAPTRTLPFGH